MSTIYGSSGDDTLNGFASNDVLFGRAGNDILNGHGGNDVLFGDTGADTMNGGDGNDIYLVDNVSDRAAETFADALGGIDTIWSSVSHTLGFGIEKLLLVGAASINGAGNSLNNSVSGNSANNVLHGLNGNDVLYGGVGNDSLLGGDHHDTLEGGLGNDFLNGGSGRDTASYSTASSAVTVNLSVLGAQVTGGAGSDTLIGIESLTGSNYADTLTGNASNNGFIGGWGKDRLTGGGGDDAFEYKYVGHSLPGAAFRDVITDFNGDEGFDGDYINLTAIDADGIAANGNSHFDYIGSAAFSAAAQVRYVGGILQASTDADFEPELEIELVGAPQLYYQASLEFGNDIYL